MEPKDPAKPAERVTIARGLDPDEPEEIEEILKDAFGNEAEHIWWVPMEFVHEFEDGNRVRITFSLKVAGRDEEDARDNAEGVTIDDIVDDNPDFDGLFVEEIRDALYETDSVCGFDCEDLQDDAIDYTLRVDDDEPVVECFD